MDQHHPTVPDRRAPASAAMEGQPWLARGPSRPVRVPMSFTDTDKFRWIRANRHNIDLLDALRHAVSDADFDAQISAAMRMSVAGPSYFGPLAQPPAAA